MNSTYSELVLCIADAPRLITKKKKKEEPEVIESDEELAAWLNIQN